MDDLYSKLSLSPYNWVELPVTADVDEFENADFQEMRDAVDYADDMNYCREHDAAYNVSVNSPYDSGVLNDHKSGVLNDDKATVQETHLSEVKEDEKSTVYSTHLYDDHNYYMESYRAIHCGLHYAEHCSAENTHVNTNYYASQEAAYNDAVNASN